MAVWEDRGEAGEYRAEGEAMSKPLVRQGRLLSDFGVGS